MTSGWQPPSPWPRIRMTTDLDVLVVRGVQVAVVRKDIKNLHIGVYPPDGHVRVAAPLVLSDSAIRAALVVRFSWIRRHQAQFAGQQRESRREIVTGESHWYLGRRYRLSVVESTGAPGVRIANLHTIELRCRPGSDYEQRETILGRWYRARLKELAGPIVESWSPVFGVEKADWRVRVMRTKWGSCSAGSERIWLNLDLIKKPRRCLEYIVVHELAHLVERRHGRPFQALLDEFLPKWRFIRTELGSLPITDSAPAVEYFSAEPSPRAGSR